MCCTNPFVINNGNTVPGINPNNDQVWKIARTFFRTALPLSDSRSNGKFILSFKIRMGFYAIRTNPEYPYSGVRESVMLISEHTCLAGAAMCIVFRIKINYHWLTDEFSNVNLYPILIEQLKKRQFVSYLNS
ncbi:MAG: hypothetical protein U5K79_13585 [Cyclobacteriaceae bacterium]|nr:hypothetical protein [Cyclobacteriaceae bacterium]